MSRHFEARFCTRCKCYDKYSSCKDWKGYVREKIIIAMYIAGKTDLCAMKLIVIKSHWDLQSNVTV